MVYKHIKIIVHHLNVPRQLCEMAFGPDHGTGHRLTAGSIIMIIGVSIAKLPAAIDIHVVVLHYLADLIGYAIHGIGLTPFLEHVIHAFEEAEKIDAANESAKAEAARKVPEETEA